MRAYIDSSVLLRLVLGQPGHLAEWHSIRAAVSSAILEIECLRTIDRLRVAGQLSTEDAVARREAVFRVLEAIELIEITPVLLHRAAQPMAAPLGTLDAIHLASADMWREVRGHDLVLATHDRALGLAARGTGFQVVGL